VSLDDIDVVVEGTASKVTDTALLERVANLYASVGWPARASAGAITAEFSARVRLTEPSVVTCTARAMSERTTGCRLDPRPQLPPIERPGDNRGPHDSSSSATASGSE